MPTKTISLSEAAYERLDAAKREGESFSDVVRWLTVGVQLEAFHVVLSAETVADLEARIAARRARHEDERRDRLGRLVDDLE